MLKLLYIEQYENEAGIVINTIFDSKISLTVDHPPYSNNNGNTDNFDNEHLFYWRCLIEWYHKQKPVMMIQCLIPLISNSNRITIINSSSIFKFSG